jgi:methylthioribose-1-phosphate isomerase
MHNDIDVRLISDSMAASAMRTKGVTKVITGADRIARNGDSANKVGTYGLAILAKHSGIPFYIAAPATTFDLSIDDGSGIPVEERDPEELTVFRGRRVAPAGAKAWNPAFDVTPAGLITGFITDQGLITAPYRSGIQAKLSARNR